MGLDQYVWALDERPETPVDFKFDAVTDDGWPDCFKEDPVYGQLFVTKPGFEALAHFRKHPNLHGAIRPIYAAKGGSNWHWNEFAGPVVLDSEDLDALEELAKKDEFPETEGFFFGVSRPEDREPTLEFIRRARTAIANGKTVVYDSSW